MTVPINILLRDLKTLQVIYVNIVQDLFHGPPLISRGGRFVWIGLVLGYWALAFVVASAIPQFSNISGMFLGLFCCLSFPKNLTLSPRSCRLVLISVPTSPFPVIQTNQKHPISLAALCILQFTYTFPPILFVGFIMQRDATKGQPAYTPGSTVSDLRSDTWHNFSRWWRGFKSLWWLNTFNVILFLAALATAGLGAFSSIQGIKAGFKQNGAATSFGCQAPV